MSEKPVNYFTLFALPIDFNISLEELEKAYLTLQKNAHPDKFATADSLQRDIANHSTATINRAYDTLKHPLGRARHLLELRNGTTADTEQTIDDVAFLMEQMQWREQIEEAEGAPEKLTQLQQEVAAHLQELYAAFGSAYHQETADPQELTVLFHKLQYFSRLDQEIGTQIHGAP